MTRDIFAVIKSRYNILTRAERCVADYVLEHPQESAYLSIVQFANKCSVGESTIFRFCCHLGYEGYHDFRLQLATSVRFNEVHNSLKQQTTDDHKAIGSHIRCAYTDILASLHETYEMLDEQQVEDAALHMHQSERILFFGVGTSLLSAVSAYQHFLRLTPKVCCSMDVRPLHLLASMLTSEDVAVAFSYSGATEETLDMATEAKRNGAYLIGITRYANSPLASLCDQLFLCGCGNVSKFPHNKLCICNANLLLINALCSAYKQSEVTAGINGVPMGDKNGFAYPNHPIKLT